MRFTFIHASDLHLDTPFKGLAQIDPALARRLRDASLVALDRIVDKAIEVQAAFVVFAGDLYDGVERGIRAQLRLHDALSRLDEQGIYSFIVHGNHDPESGGWTAVRSWPERVTIFGPGRPQCVPVERGGRTLATVHGVSYGARAEQDNLALRFPSVSDGGVRVGVLHASVEKSDTGHERYSPCTIEDLRSRGMTYWALGHVHRHMILSRAPWIVYSGNTQGRDPGPGEQGAKGALVVEVDQHAVTRVEPFATDSARFFGVDVDLRDIDDIGDVEAHLRHQADALVASNPGVDLLLRGSLHGHSPLYRELRSPARRGELLDALRDRADQHVGWLDLFSDVHPAIDLDRIRHSQDLRAAVLETWERWREDPARELPDTLRRGLARVGTPGEDVLATLLDEAARDVLERLSVEAR
jgi:DNA repair protein SbcD/Mre11